MNVRIILVVVGDEKRLGVFHAEGFERFARRLLHLLAARRFAGAPMHSERCTQSCSHFRVRLRWLSASEFHDRGAQARRRPRW